MDSRTSPPHSQGGTWDRSGGTPRFELHDSLYSNTSESVLGNSAEKSKCEIKKKNLSLISFEMQTEMFDRAWLRYVGIQQPASKAALLLNATLGRRGGRNLVTPL